MKIKFISGPRAGEISHAEKSQSTQLLIDAGLIEVATEAAPPPPPILWNVGTGMSGRAHVRCQSGHNYARVEIYDGPPQLAVAAFKKIGLAMPEDIAAKYAAKFAPVCIRMPEDEVAVAHAIRHGALDNLKR